MKKILLIGKYPPLQGGISTKTYWLYQELQSKGYDFRVVTVSPNNYSIKSSETDFRCFVANEEEVPWHIPNSNLISDRLINLALQATCDFNPDIVEVNYMWPFLSVGILISKIVNAKLIFRHAGSDILKFYKNAEFKQIMKNYLLYPDLIITNDYSFSVINEMMSESTRKKLLRINRYIPNPEHFCVINSERKYDILYIGKINYHWNLKGLEDFLEIVKTQNLNALMIADGNYIHKFKDKIDKGGLNGKIQIINFVTPHNIPKYLNLSKYIWCWEENSAIVDFSNIIWEACFCGASCIINKGCINGIEWDVLIKHFNNQLLITSKEKLKEVDLKETITIMNCKNITDKKSDLYKKYINSNLDVYR